MKALPILLLLIVAGCSHADPFGRGQWVDLTWELSEESIFWPTATPFRLEPVFEGETDQGFYYSAFSFCSDEHGGTHIDAPIHFAAGRQTVDQLPLERLIGPAVVVDVSAAAAADRDYQITVDDLVSWERQHGRIADGDIVLFRTGFARFWPDRMAYLGTDKRGEAGVAELSFPGLHPEAARWLVANRRIAAVGIDTASIDYGRSTLFESHVALMSVDIPAFENVARLDALPPRGAGIVALPTKIRGGSGAPLRIVAFIPER
jgi:kynurenine formamidase